MESVAPSEAQSEALSVAPTTNTLPAVPPTPEPNPCAFCEQNIQGTPQEFPCGHRCDIQCMIVETAAHFRDFQEPRCPTCHEEVFSTEMSDRIMDRYHILHYHAPHHMDLENDNQIEKLEQLAQTSAEFKEEIKKVKLVKKEQNQAKKAASQVRRTEQQLWKTQTHSTIQMLKNIHKERIKSLLSSPEWKKKNVLYRKGIKLLQHISDKWDVSRRMVARYFHLDDFRQDRGWRYRHGFRVSIW